MILENYDNQPCPICKHKIGEHKDSVFSNNPVGENGVECNRSHHGLVIDILTVWLKDALKERDDYRKSYDDALKDGSDYFESFLNITTVAANAVTDRDIFKKRLDVAMDALLWYSENALRGQLADKAIAEIEKIK